jgi:hypothetical protein
LKYILLFPLLLFASCKSDETKQKESIEHTFKTYITAKLETIDSTYTIDTLRLYKIDTVSTKDDFLFKMVTLSDSLDKLSLIATNAGQIAKLKMDQYKTLAYMNTLTTTSSDLSIFKEDAIENNKKALAAYDKVIELGHNIDSLTGIYNSSKLDSTNFLYYKVYSVLCYSEKNLSQKCDSIGLKISKNFRVIE